MTLHPGAHLDFLTFLPRAASRFLASLSSMVALRAASCASRSSFSACWTMGGKRLLNTKAESMYGRGRTYLSTGRVGLALLADEP